MGHRGGDEGEFGVHGGCRDVRTFFEVMFFDEVSLGEGEVPSEVDVGGFARVCGG